MEEEKKSTAVQPEEAPKPKPRRRKAASPRSAADKPPAPTDSAEPPAADGQSTKKPAASPKKPRAKKTTKTTKTAKTAKPKTPKAAKTAKKVPADETPESKAPVQESPAPAAPGFETGPEPKSESKPEPPETPAREDAAAPTVPDVPSTPEPPEPAERAEPAGTEPEPAADAPAADDTPAAEAPPEAAAADTAVTDTPDQTGDAPAEDAAEPSGFVFSDDLANDKDLAAEAARMANISRTAQLSIAQIMAGLEEDPAPSAGPAPAPEAPQHDSAADADEDDEPRDTIPQAIGRGAFGMFKWLLLVVLFVLIIAGGGVAWLYHSATPDMLPEVKVTFDGQELAPTAYKWHVPVVGSFFRRTYAETLNSSPVVLEDAISDASPDIVVTPSDYSTQLTITDADRETVYEGSATGFRSYLFAENGTFDAKLVVTASDSAAEGSVTGTETWQFRFTVSIKPSVTLCTPTVQQGSVAAVRVGSTMSQTAPTLTGPLESTGFVRAANGWICYLPIPWNAETGNTELTVTADGYTETLTLSVRAASYSYKDYSAKSQLTSPYIGENDAPDAVRKLLTTAGEDIQWSVGGFVQPFLDSFDTPLLYGMTEYVGRAYSERSTNYGYGGRTSTNVVIKPKKSKDSMIVPASGHVLLAEDLGGSYGYTVVIDHGAGLRSIFYGLTALDVKAGDDVKQGQLLGTSGRTVVAEMRIGTVPINPLLVWRGQCDGLKYY
ncbi:peptidoglycan DD-metalloendopeptidase family protein [uncultured Gemmiger sp.]|uniref:peptidoglycan DD-metalloendopeptidase family protein n=1 Tax=uncultured Gemmiger sp. TaxID=1623490 RepID=UPI002593CA2D|nr:peptidoglycan DD-metalloendopeptidase family protein [uncultured Gemmiger sp.]